MIEPKPDDEPAALEELPAGAGAGAGNGAGVGAAPPGVEIWSLPYSFPPRGEEADSGMTAPLAIRPARPTTDDAGVLRAPLRCISPLGRLLLWVMGHVELGAASSATVEDPGVPPPGSAAVEAW
jgi:hypothetical protein